MNSIRPQVIKVSITYDIKTQRELHSTKGLEITDIVLSHLPRMRTHAQSL